MTELSDEMLLKDREYRRALDDCRRSERAANDERSRLSDELDAARHDQSDLQLKLAAATGRVEALEVELDRVDQVRRRLNVQLATIVTTLRRSVGLVRGVGSGGGGGGEGSGGGRQWTRSRSPSPTLTAAAMFRRGSPERRSVRFGRTRSASPVGRGSSDIVDVGGAGDVEVDVNSIKDTLRGLVQQVVETQREKVFMTFVRQNTAS